MPAYVAGMALWKQVIDEIGEARWLTRERVIAWGRVLLIVQAALLIFLALWQHGAFVPVDVTPASDFVSFYAAGKLALAGTPQLAYDQAAHYLAQQQATAPNSAHQYFFYPPTYLMLCAVLALVPYFVALTAFEVVTLIMFLMMMRALLRERGTKWLAPVLAFPAVFWTLGLGQNSFLTAALFGGFTLLLDRRPLGAGVLLGMLCYKPHLGLLAPVALIAGRRWSAFLAAAGSVTLLVGLSVALFGWRTWQAYFAALAQSDQIYSTGLIDYAGIVTPFGAMRLMGFSPASAYAVQSGTAVVMLALTALLWRRDLHSTPHPPRGREPTPDLIRGRREAPGEGATCSTLSHCVGEVYSGAADKTHAAPSANLRAASLLCATLLAAPLALLYDKLLLVVAIGWLLREAREQAFLKWEKLVLIGVYPASLLAWPIGQAFHLPLGPFIACFVLLLCLRRVWLYHRSQVFSQLQRQQLRSLEQLHSA